jgi:hypothetical protein
VLESSNSSGSIVLPRGRGAGTHGAQQRSSTVATPAVGVKALVSDALMSSRTATNPALPCAEQLMPDTCALLVDDTAVVAAGAAPASIITASQGAVRLLRSSENLQRFGVKMTCVVCLCWSHKL